MRVTKSNTQSRPIIKGLFFGTILSMVFIFLGICAVATMLIKENLTENAAEHIIRGILALSVLIGSFAAAKFIKQKYAICCILHAAIVGVILIGVHIFMYPGVFKNAVSTVVMLTLGGLSACLLCAKSMTGHRKYRNR